MMVAIPLPGEDSSPRWKISKGGQSIDIFPESTPSLTEFATAGCTYEHLQSFNIGHVSVQCPGQGAWRCCPFSRAYIGQLADSD